MEIIDLAGRTAWLRQHAPHVLRAPQVTMLLPAVSLAAYWIGGETGLFVLAVAVPVLGALANLKSTSQLVEQPLRRAALEAALDRHLAQRPTTGRTTACLVVRVDDFQDLASRVGGRGSDPVIERVGARLKATLRANDLIARLDDASFGVALTPVARIDLEAMLQIAARLQAAVTEAVPLDQTSLRLSASIGFCQADRLPFATGASLIEAAEAAATEARRHAAGSIRAYSRELQQKRETNDALLELVEDALETGEIRPWFQPQISTDTGRVTGFEALARWLQPEKGLISPAEFLPVIEKAGLMERLGEVILAHSLNALRSWDRAGLEIPRVGVNFSGAELANPKLVDKISWQLDRYDLTPDRLAIEILETVISEAPDDVVSRNINGLANLGCLIDLDDFGTGHASITSIRRFAIGRLKIDRSFVTKVDEDPEQQRMIGAIVTMAEHLNLDCLAEGVETGGEHAMLSQLGCAHVQGFALGRPMPFEDTPEWLRRHAAKIDPTPSFNRKIG